MCRHSPLFQTLRKWHNFLLHSFDAFFDPLKSDGGGGAARPSPLDICLESKSSSERKEGEQSHSKVNFLPLLWEANFGGTQMSPSNK